MDHVTDPLDPQKMAKDLKLGYSWFRRMFKHYIGLSPIQYQLQLRIQRACRMLSYSSKSSKEIAFDLGFESSSYFTKIFKNKMGVTPQTYRRQYQEKLKHTAGGQYVKL
jgi:AraC-like DNA-binding protein